MKTIFQLRKRRKGYWRRLLVTFACELGIALVVAVWFGVPAYIADRVIHPPRLPLGTASPIQYGLIYRDVSFRTADGLLLSAWYIPGSGRATVVILHGAPGNRVPHLEQAALLSQHGYAVLLVDQRAQGASEGATISLTGEDARAAVRYLESRAAGEPPRIGLLGYSLGAYNSIQAAADLPQVRAVVADGVGATHFSDDPPQRSLLDTLSAPFYWTGYQVWAIEGATGQRTMMEGVRLLAGRPVLFITGGQNGYEAELGRRYYAAAGQPKELWEILETGHTGGWNARREEYSRRLVEFFDRALK